MSDVRAHVLVSGKVQGVFYRVWTKSNAKDLNLTGWVRNTEDGKVEAVLEGESDDVDQMLKRMKQGSEMSQVDDVEFDFKEITNEFNEFEIRT